MNYKRIWITTGFGPINVIPYDNVEALLYNATLHHFTFIDEETQHTYQPVATRIAQDIYARIPVTLFAKDANNATFKIYIESALDEEWGGWQPFIFLYPVEPWKMKKGLDAEQEEIDLAYYIERMLELSEGFVIWELVAE